MLVNPGIALAGLLALGVVAAASSHGRGSGGRMAPEAFRALCARWGAFWGVPALVLEVIGMLESSGHAGMFDNESERAVSRGGAWGLFGMTLQTAHELFAEHGAAFAKLPPSSKWDGTGRSLLDPELNAMLAAFEASRDWHRFNGDVMATIAAHEQGPGPVAHVLARGGNLATDLPPHGRTYVARAAVVLNELSGGRAAA